MSAEIWQFAVLAVMGAAAVALWILFVYLPRRTGEDATHEPSEEDLPHDRGNGPQE